MVVDVVRHGAAAVVAQLAEPVRLDAPGVLEEDVVGPHRPVQHRQPVRLRVPVVRHPPAPRHHDPGLVAVALVQPRQRLEHAQQHVPAQALGQEVHHHLAVVVRARRLGKHRVLVEEALQRAGVAKVPQQHALR